MSSAAPWVVLGALTVVVTIGGGMAGCPAYNVWNAEMTGRAELARADQNREIMVRQARAKADAATLEALAEVERAKGVAQANQIIGDSLAGERGAAYLRWLWISGMAENKERTVIYLPNDGGLPILESQRLAPDQRPTR